MDKRARQYLGLVLATACYYLLHEGAHALYALATGTFRAVRFMGLGIQIDITAAALTNVQLCLFCAAGAVTTLIFGYVLAMLTPKICRSENKPFKAVCYYTTMILMLLDPLYLSLLCGFFGGGDMNGIALLIPEVIARCGFGILLIINALFFLKKILPQYSESFRES